MNLTGWFGGGGGGGGGEPTEGMTLGFHIGFFFTREEAIIPLFITPTTLSLGCHSWHKHEVRLSMCCN